MLDPIALAVPVFFVLIAVEMAWAKRRGLQVYRFADALTALSCGITSQVVLLAWVAVQLGIYASVYERFRVFTWSSPVVPWIVAFVGVDFLYYWWHRLSHEVNILWAAHVVHHQSEDYNLAVALRQAVLTSWTVLPFYLPLALLGVPTVVFATAQALSTLYQFWIHTQLVRGTPRLLGRVLNMPSHHRVHHAVNARYLDKNYGATLIVWDRLFGTYEDEVEPPVYGITKPLESFDPLYAQVGTWVDLARASRAARRPLDKIRVFFRSPSFSPEGAGPAEPLTDDMLRARPKHDVPVSRAMKAYVAAQYALVVVATFALMTWHARLPTVAVLGAGLAILAAVYAVGALLEQRRWARPFELARWLFAAAAVAVWLGSR